MHLSIINLNIGHKGGATLTWSSTLLGFTKVPQPSHLSISNLAFSISLLFVIQTRHLDNTLAMLLTVDNVDIGILENEKL